VDLGVYTVDTWGARVGVPRAGVHIRRCLLVAASTAQRVPCTDGHAGQLVALLVFVVLDPDLDKYRRIDARDIVNAAMETVAGGVDEDVRADYLECYDGDRFVESMSYARRYPEQLPELAELLPLIETPVTVINGRHDRVVPLANAEFLVRRLPNSRLVIIDKGHFIWEEAPAEYASAVIETVTALAGGR